MWCLFLPLPDPYQEVRDYAVQRAGILLTDVGSLERPNTQLHTQINIRKKGF